MRRTALITIALSAFGNAAQAQRAPGWIGIGFEVKSTQSAPATGAVVTEVLEGSPAAGAGIRVGDVLLTINDVNVMRDSENLAERLALRVGDSVRILLERDGRRRELSLRAAERPSDFSVWTPSPDVPSDSMAEEMFRAMDSLRVQILAMTRAPSPPPAPRSPRARLVVEPGVAPEPPEPIDAPFEFFVFRGAQHDSLQLEMEALNRRIASLREREEQLTARRREQRSARLDAQLAELRNAIAEVTRESSALRAAMAEAARATAGLEYFTPSAPTPDASFRPLTPYLLGSNRVAGAEVVDIRPGLAEYFGVETGVLVVDVSPGTPAAIAGIQAGDVIMNLDRVAVRSVDELRSGISRAPDALPVTLVRRGARLEVLLRRR